MSLHVHALYNDPLSRPTQSHARAAPEQHRSRGADRTAAVPPAPHGHARAQTERYIMLDTHGLPPSANAPSRTQRTQCHHANRRTEASLVISRGGLRSASPQPTLLQDDHETVCRKKMRTRRRERSLSRAERRRAPAADAPAARRVRAPTRPGGASGWVRGSPSRECHPPARGSAHPRGAARPVRPSQAAVRSRPSPWR